MDSTGSDRARTTIAFLRRMITSGQWPVGSKIPTEPELMELLGVGRTTVREAVRSLATLGMLETAVSRGTFVRSRLPVSTVLADFVADFGIDEILGLRRAIEVEACRLAALNRTPEHVEALWAAYAADATTDIDYPGRREQGRTPGQFHALVLDASGNPLMASLYAGVMTGLRAAIDRGEVVFGASAEIRAHDHRRILVAIEEGDPVAAAHAASDHADHDLVVPEPAAAP